MSVALVVNQSALQTTAVCTGILLIKYQVTLMKHGLSKFHTGERPPEDGAVTIVSGGKPQNFAVNKDVPADRLATEKRNGRIVSNDIENIPLGLIVAWTGLLTGGAETHASLVMAFTAARVLHSVVYAYGLQPWRGIVWTVGVASVFVMAAQSISRVL